jgi:hypothetical protein
MRQRSEPSSQYPCSSRVPGLWRANGSSRAIGLWSVVAAGLLSAACQGDADVEVPVNVITEHRELRAGAGEGKLGEDCAAGGASDCASRLCLQSANVKATSAGRAGAYVCSAPCETLAQCPDEWSCVQFYPGEGGRACVPPQGWVPHAARLRASPR